MLASATALELDLDTVNVNGGAVAVGHPLAGSGLRLVLTLAYELRRRGGGLGIATLCGGGGQGEAILLRVLDVVVIGAGPYGLATAKALRDRGLSVTVYGKPMGFWRDHMPDGMLLRSGPDWHMDAAGELTFRAFCPDPPDPIPLGLFLDYAAWFQAPGRDRGDRGGAQRAAGRTVRGRRAGHRVLPAPARVGHGRGPHLRLRGLRPTSPARSC